MRRLWAILGTALFLIVAPGTAAILGPWLITRWRVAPPFLGTQATLGLGAGFLAVGLSMLLECFARFAIEGIGTPAPVFPTERLVVRGLYRYVRNPMYLAVVSIVLGEALMLASPALVVYAAGLALGFHLFVVLYEEPTLRRTHGAAYAAFCARVPRWLPRSGGLRRVQTPPPR
jgi:protein-S-isoprenylcysteine O-methyltransferase Ste14